MKSQLESRLTQLKSEFQSGQKSLAELQAQQNDLQATMLRISGAIQVIEEELAKANGAEQE
jgi:chromosome segregation ATPase